MSETMTLTTRETMPGYYDWYWPDGSIVAHNVPLGDSPRLPRGWRWVDDHTVVDGALELEELEKLEEALNACERWQRSQAKADPDGIAARHMTWYDWFDGQRPNEALAIDGWEIVRDHRLTSGESTETVVRERATGRLALIAAEDSSRQLQPWCVWQLEDGE